MIYHPGKLWEVGNVLLPTPRNSPTQLALNRDQAMTQRKEAKILR